MNLYLIYLATLISTYGFNTYFYIRNRIDVNKIKNRNLIYKKNLSHDTKFTIKEAELIPSFYYLGASLLSLIPIYNLFVPEKMGKVYIDSDIEGLSKEYINVANEQEIIQRYANGVAIKVMEELGFEVPDKFKEIETKPSDISINDRLREDINSVISTMFSQINSDNIGFNIENINPISNKEFKKRERIILRLSDNRNINNEKLDNLL